jgi:shikimate dehydrogenase
MIKKEMIKKFGLVGKNIDYSFSKNYFSEKFINEALKNHAYVNFDFSSIEGFTKLLKEGPILAGLNITIPYKKEVIPFLDRITKDAQTIGAVNTIVWEKDGTTTGQNTDHVGFQKALEEISNKPPEKALILGTGGASGAIKFVLNKMGCEVQFVSRQPKQNILNYGALDKSKMDEVDLIVNTTPLGTFPDIEKMPPIPYQWITKKHLLFDLIYNPEETTFMKLGKSKGAKTTNGYKMLIYQAEKSWELWNS